MLVSIQFFGGRGSGGGSASRGGGGGGGGASSPTQAEYQRQIDQLISQQEKYIQRRNALGKDFANIGQVNRLSEAISELNKEIADLYLKKSRARGA